MFVYYTIRMLNFLLKPFHSICMQPNMMLNREHYNRMPYNINNELINHLSYLMCSFRNMDSLLSCTLIYFIETKKLSSIEPSHRQKGKRFKIFRDKHLMANSKLQ